MELFHNARAVRLRNHHGKYLYAADEYEDSVTQDRDGSSRNARWSVEFVGSNFIRLKSCYDMYLTASNVPFLLGMTGRKVLQTATLLRDSPGDWEPIREGDSQVKLRTTGGQFLRANGGLPPWRNSVTHDVPHRTVTHDWILWEVDVIEIVVQSPGQISAPRLPLAIRSGADSDSFSSPRSPSTGLNNFPSRQELGDWDGKLPSKVVDWRTIYYHVITEEFGEMDENSQGFSLAFKGSGVDELTRKLEEETGLHDITVCTRSPLNGKLQPLRLLLPPNSVTMHVFVVGSSLKVW